MRVEPVGSVRCGCCTSLLHFFGGLTFQCQFEVWEGPVSPLAELPGDRRKPLIEDPCPVVSRVGLGYLLAPVGHHQCNQCASPSHGREDELQRPDLVCSEAVPGSKNKASTVRPMSPSPAARKETPRAVRIGHIRKRPRSGDDSGRRRSGRLDGCMVMMRR